MRGTAIASWSRVREGEFLSMNVAKLARAAAIGDGPERSWVLCREREGGVDRNEGVMERQRLGKN